VAKGPDGIPDTMWVDGLTWGQANSTNKIPSPNRNKLEAEIKAWIKAGATPEVSAFSKNPEVQSMQLPICNKGPKDPPPPPNSYTPDQLEKIFNDYARDADCLGNGSIANLSTNFTKYPCSTPANIAQNKSYMYALVLLKKTEVSENLGVKRTNPYASFKRSCLLPYKIELAQNEVGSMVDGVPTRPRAPYPLVDTRDNANINRFDYAGQVQLQKSGVFYGFAFQSYLNQKSIYEDTQQLYREVRAESKFAGFFRAAPFGNLERDIPAVLCTDDLKL
jgi:hypothetical protein